MLLIMFRIFVFLTVCKNEPFDVNECPIGYTLNQKKNCCIGKLQQQNYMCTDIRGLSVAFTLYTSYIHGLCSFNTIRALSTSFTLYTSYIHGLRSTKYNPRLVCAIPGFLRKARIRGLHNKICGWSESVLCA